MKKSSSKVTVHTYNSSSQDGYMLLLLFIKDMQPNAIGRVRELKVFTKVWVNKVEKKQARNQTALVIL